MALIANNKNLVWLSPDVLQWSTYSQGGAELEVTVRARAYEIWSHAESTLALTTTKPQLVDLITTLKRSIDQRLRALDEIYSFRSNRHIGLTSAQISPGGRGGYQASF